jgi:hypothetical protein
VLAPLGLWAMYFLVLATVYNVGWPAELAVGVGAIASMISLMLAYLMTPAPVGRLLLEDPGSPSAVGGASAVADPAVVGLSG